MGVEVSLPPNTVPGGSVERPVTALSAASSDSVSPSHIKATSRSATPASKTVTQECKPTAVAPALNVNGVTSRTSSMGDTTAASRRKTLDLDSATITRQETKCNREFYVQDPVLLRPPRSPGNVAVGATGYDVSGNVNQVSTVQGNPFMIPKEELTSVELPASNFLGSVSSAIIQESFEVSESLYFFSIEPPAHINLDVTQQRITTASIESSLSPCIDTAVPDTAPTIITPSILKSAAESSIGNVVTTYATIPVKIKDAPVPVAVTYADATNLAVQYPDLASQILVAPLRMRIASREVSLTADQESAEDSLSSKRRHLRKRGRRRRRSQDDLKECQQGDSPVRPFHQKDFNFAPGSWRTSQQPSRSVDPASPIPITSVKRTPSLQMNRHTASAPWEEKMRSRQRESRHTDLGAPTAGMWATTGMNKSSEASTPPPTGLAMLKRAPAQEQHNPVSSRRKERTRATKAMDSITTSDWRRPGNTDVLLTELFCKAMDAGSSSATRIGYSEMKSRADGPNSETTCPANRVVKIIEDDLSCVRLPPPVTPPRKTQSLTYKPPAARTEEDHAMYQSYKLPHQRMNDSDHYATSMHTPPLSAASPPSRHSSSYMPPSPRMTELLERSEHVRHVKRLLATECDVPIDITGLGLASPKETRVLQPIGPWQASDERAFHRRGAMNLGTSTPRTGSRYAGASVIEQNHNGFDGVRQRSGPMVTEETGLRNLILPSEGLTRRPPCGGGYRSVIGQSLETSAPAMQWSRFR
ncbi:hypothetical protein K503DRAFT_795808 [Rhizopogon vinicolor AM-OR11-026]|uniref:Uncharacterized protein n=1 Tax=Rhizopogon vinicolor AM-OR11-026 TaxID=1314800 RepID=A0A1B7NGL9_9AGAM|nr:hypothetical protein K503DRAFT_795808 [Rhizopogon vinicolor AM-OR11-026]